MTTTNTPQGSTSEPQGTASADTAATRGFDRRACRIADYQAAALDEDSPLIANVGAVNSDLMQIQHYLRQVLDNALTETAPSLEELSLVLPGIDQAVKITKQIDRFTQLEMRLKAAEQEAARAAAAREASLGDVQHSAL